MKKINIKVLLFLIPVAFALTFTACNKSNKNQTADITNKNSQAIINGDVVSADEPIFFMTARLFYKYKTVWYPMCTGSIVANDLVLTAAHCVEGIDPEELRWGFGAQPFSAAGQKNPETRIDIEEKFKINKIEKIITHPKYGESRYDHDFALTKLTEAIPDGFYPVALLPDQLMRKIPNNKTYKVILAGFGLTSETPQVESAVLRKTAVDAFFEGLHVVTDQTQGRGGCSGDSGGPMYLTVQDQLYLVGVTHGPYKVSDCYNQGAWSNPVFEREWLNKAAGEMGSSFKF